jgi:hypothetical protein
LRDEEKKKKKKKKMMNIHRILVGKPEEKRPLERPRRGWMILKWILEE